MRKVANLVVLISGNGSNLQAILDASENGSLPVRVSAVISNKPDAYGLERARQSNIPAVIHPFLKGQDRRAYDLELGRIVSTYHPDWVILAGWMRILSQVFLEHFPDHVVNLHPALPGTFPGTHAIQRAFVAYQNEEIDHTGVMVHLVPDEGVDTGPVLNQRVVPILPTDSLESLEARIHAVEHILLVETITQLLRDANGGSS